MKKLKSEARRVKECENYELLRAKTGSTFEINKIQFEQQKIQRGQICGFKKEDKSPTFCFLYFFV
jgi:hypothetical protein